MGSTVVAVFLGFFTLAMGQAVIRRKRNPYGEIAYAELPAALRSEVERVLPDFAPGAVKITKRGDEARLEGSYLGANVSVEADFDPAGELVDFEIETRTGVRRTGIANPDDMTDAARSEVDRVLGPHRASFQPGRITQGATRDGERAFEMKGYAGEWKCEIEVSATGRLLELEMEKRRR